MMNNIRKMDLEDLSFVVDIHLAAFMGFFLSSMGKQFLREFYNSVLLDETHIAFVCQNKVNILGFVAGTTQPFGFYKHAVKRRWWRFAFSALMPALKNPLIVPRLLRAIRKPKDVLCQPNRGTLMSIAVVPEAQGQGIGQVLVETFLEEAAKRGLKQIDLTTDKNNNDRVNQFYRSIGFRCLRTFSTPEGREMNEYIIDI